MLNFQLVRDAKSMKSQVMTLFAFLVALKRSPARRGVTRFQPLQGIARFYRYRLPLLVALNGRVARGFHDRTVL